MSNNGTPILVRTSERASFLTCRWKWKWGWVDGLRSVETDPKLLFGDLVHQALAKYYKPGRKRGPHPAQTFEKLYMEVEAGKVWSGDEEKWVDMGDLGVTMLERYVEHWSNAPVHNDNEYEIIASEQIFSVPIGYKIGDRPVWYVGTVDGVWRNLATGKIRFLETKTATAIKKDALPMDEQVGAYWTFGPMWLKRQGLLDSVDDLDGILYNWLRKAVPNPDGNYDSLGRLLNKDGSHSKRQPPPFFDRQVTYRGHAEAEAVKYRVKRQVEDMERAKRRPALHVYKNPGAQFMPNCKFCSFRDACELHETGSDYQTFIDHAFEKHNPYSAHELPERF